MYVTEQNCLRETIHSRCKAPFSSSYFDKTEVHVLCAWAGNVRLVVCFCSTQW